VSRSGRSPAKVAFWSVGAEISETAFGTLAVVAADVLCVSCGEDKHTATAPASIAMMRERLSIRVPTPA
jgi:hypothetical protein